MKLSAIKRAASLMGRAGGRKGGLAKHPKKGFGSLSPAKRKAIARKAALARWARE